MSKNYQTLPRLACETVSKHTMFWIFFKFLILETNGSQSVSDWRYELYICLPSQLLNYQSIANFFAGQTFSLFIASHSHFPVITDL